MRSPESELALTRRYQECLKADVGIRTRDLLLTMQALYRLSYVGLTLPHRSAEVAWRANSCPVVQHLRLYTAPPPCWQLLL
jgi:hypothetical protein